MKKYLFFLTSALLLVSTITIFAQNHYNIRLSPNEVSPLGKVCYDIQLASADGIDLNLAGQNYRLYYDANQLSYDKASSQILLPEEKYTALAIKDNLQNIDASGAGSLEFNRHLSFLNIGNDLKDEENGGTILPADGNWISTANVCFKLKENDNQAAMAKKFNVYWARPTLTQSYATAYVEIAEWTGPEQTRPAKAGMYVDQELSTSLETLANNTLSVYPNPTKDKVFIKYEGKEAFFLQVYNGIGQLMLTNKYPANSTNPSVDLGDLAAGMYQLRINTATKQIVQKIEKIY
ncbi:MAG: T9SS type A sorting domain-containing protein [Saprospiraceae bacterium]